MAVTSGFFDAVTPQGGEPDRVYSSKDFGSLFDGIITDGVFKDYPNAEGNFKVSLSSVNGEAIKVFVAPGRAWFNKTWTLNNTTREIELDPPTATAYRRDAIVLRVDARNSKRYNEIYALKGPENPSGNATIPMLTNNNDVHEYLLAVVYVKATKISGISNRSVEITNVVGNTKEYSQAAPYSAAIEPTKATVKSIITSLINQFNAYQETYQIEFDEWFAGIIGELGVLSVEQTVRLSLMIGEIYRTEYVSGRYPYVDAYDRLYLSLDDTGETPEVTINFGYASLPYFPNNRAKQVIVEEHVPYSLLFTFIGDGETTTFTITDSISEILSVTINGEAAYPTISGSSFTFSTAPANNAVIVASARPETE